MDNPAIWYTRCPMHGIANLNSDCQKCPYLLTMSSLWVKADKSIQVGFTCKAKEEESMSSGIRDEVFKDIEKIAESMKTMRKSGAVLPEVLVIDEQEGNRVRVPAGPYYLTCSDNYFSYLPAFDMTWEAAQVLLGKGYRIARKSWPAGTFLIRIAEGDYSINKPVIRGIVVAHEPWIAKVKLNDDTYSMSPWLGCLGSHRGEHDWMYVQ